MMLGSQVLPFQAVRWMPATAMGMASR